VAEWWAIKPINTAFQKTRKLLLEPFSVWTWIKLMVIVFFVGTGASSMSSVFSNIANYRSSSRPAYTNSDINQMIHNTLANTGLMVLIILLALAFVIIVLILAYLRNVFSFVFIKAVASGDVRVIKPAMENLGRGFRLFIFSVIASLIALIVAAILIGLIALGVLMVMNIGAASAGSVIMVMLIALLIIILVLLLIAFFIAATIFIGFTYDFVAPMMLNKNMGVVQAWKQLWSSIKSNWQQYGVYVIVRFLVQIAVGILLLIVLLPFTLIFAAIFIVGLIIAAAVSTTAIWLTVLIGLLLLLLAVVFIIFVMAVSMPVSVYFRYYSLDVLKQIDPSAITYADKFTFPPPQGMLPP
jgi:hypothetical protein